MPSPGFTCTAFATWVPHFYDEVMGRIGGSADATRDLKELYERREQESDVNHKTEIKTLKSQHAEEISRLRDENEQRVQNAQQESVEKLSAKDAQYQKEIDTMRTLHQKRLIEARRGKPE